MFGLGFSEIVIIAVLALILIGPKELPEVARVLGRFINDLKRSSDHLAEEIKSQAKWEMPPPAMSDEKPPEMPVKNESIDPIGLSAAQKASDDKESRS